jgi:hypothetical protein
MKNLYKTIMLVFIIISMIFTHQNCNAQTPTTPASGVSFSSIDGNRFRVSFTPGNGAKRIIVAKEASPVTAIPSDGVDYVAGNFGSGNEIAPGEFVVYEGSASSNIPINGLDHSTTYHIRIYEFNGSNTNTTKTVPA